VASPRDHGYGLARMWEALVEWVGWETMAFRSLTEAEDWIRRRVKEKFGIDLANPTGVKRRVTPQTLLEMGMFHQHLRRTCAVSVE
jgi:hypothetical protein